MNAPFVPTAALAALLIASLGATALAAPPARRRGARIAWVRGVDADRCVGIQGLEEDVEARLGYDPFALPSELSVEGAVRRAPDGFRAEVVMRDPSGQVIGGRRLASPAEDCRSLGDAVAVAITVAIDAHAGETQPPLALDVPPSARLPDDARPPLAASAPPAPWRARGRVAASVGASGGVLPGLAWVTSLRARVGIDERWELGVGAHLWPESRTDRFGFGLATAALDGCVAPFTSLRRALRWCLAVHVGLFQAFVHAPDLTPIEVGTFAWVGAETGPTASFPLFGPFRVDGSVSVIVPALRPQAQMRNEAGWVWEQSRVGGRADVGLGADF